MSLTNLIRLISISVVTVLTAACIHFSTETVTLVDAQKARTFSDGFMEDAVNDRQDALYAKMENEFHQSMSREKFADLMAGLDEQFGKIRKYEFDYDEAGAKILYTGKKKPTRIVFYKVTTTKGSYPMSVSVVQDGADLGVTDFLFHIEAK